MKRWFLCAAILLGTAFAEEEMVSIPKSKLTEQQKAELVVHDAKQNVKAVSELAGMGKEVGEAVDSGLSAISNRANEFANTKVGTVTMWVVMFKLVGPAAIHTSLGLLMWAIGIPTWLFFFYRRCFVRNVLAKKYKDERGKTVKEYRLVEPKESREFPASLAYTISLALYLVASLAVLFGY